MKKFLKIPAALLSVRLGKKCPVAVRWNITEKCLHNCVYCNIKNIAVPAEEMDTESIKKTIDIITPHIVYVTLSGGEPLIRDDIGEIVDYLDYKGVHTELNTSGVLIRERINEIKKVGKFKVSVEGREKIHNLLRGAGTYRKVLEGLEELKKNKLKACVTVTLTRANLDELDYLIAFSLRMEANIRFEPLFGGELSPAIMKNYPDKERLRGAVDKIIQNKKIYKHIENSIAELEYIKKWPDYDFQGCLAGRLYFIIRANGCIQSCDHIIPVGDKIRQESISLLDCGYKEAVSRLRNYSCRGCGCLSSLGLSLSLRKNLGVAVDIIRKRL